MILSPELICISYQISYFWKELPNFLSFWLNMNIKQLNKFQEISWQFPAIKINLLLKFQVIYIQNSAQTASMCIPEILNSVETQKVIWIKVKPER